MFHPVFGIGWGERNFIVEREVFDVPSAGSVITGAVMVIVSLLVAGSIMTRGHRHLAIASWDTMVDASLRVFLKMLT